MDVFKGYPMIIWSQITGLTEISMDIALSFEFSHKKHKKSMFSKKSAGIPRRGFLDLTGNRAHH
jgi:hypothetical protein